MNRTKDKRITCKLDTDSINETIKYLQNYRDSLQQKTEIFVKRLEDIGVSTAYTRLTPIGDMGSLSYYVHFNKNVYPTLNGCTGVIEMDDNMKVVRMWLGIDDNHNQIVKSAEISPTLMYEFGSGIYATSENATMLHAKVPVGKGTFPSEDNKPIGNRNHVNDKWESWQYKGLDGIWRRSRGIKPTQPMYHAWMAMCGQVETIAKEVFG